MCAPSWSNSTDPLTLHSAVVIVSLPSFLLRRYHLGTYQMSDELALCYYKKSIDPEVRGWIYLKDVAQIAEDKDTMTITSAARTLHLYAQTRAEHNMWVKGLAKLCPSAFLKLEREAILHIDLYLEEEGPCCKSRVVQFGLVNTRCSAHKIRVHEWLLRKKMFQEKLFYPS